MMQVTVSGRRIIRASGPDATHLLHNVLTPDIEGLPTGVSRAGALLSPQGKIQTDLMIRRAGPDAYMIDLPQDEAEAFLKRMVMYRLRSKVEFAEQTQSVVTVSFNPDSASSSDESGSSDIESTPVRDERFKTVTVMRTIRPGMLSSPADESAWHALRIRHGIAECGADYAPGDAFPHDAGLDQTHGVDFRKGCYVGQEVVSRMQHRGTARRRPVIVTPLDGTLPSRGTELLADGKPAGALGTVLPDGSSALAIVRLDRIADAVTARVPVLAGDIAVSCAIPPDMAYAFPDTGAGDDDA